MMVIFFLLCNVAWKQWFKPFDLFGVAWVVLHHPEGFMTFLLVGLARGKIVSALEGGYICQSLGDLDREESEAL